MRQRELFLHMSGSASRDLGFHTLLADMLAWSLPQVATFTGETTTLYPDVLFPFLIIDQQSWGSAGPRKVERYQIREPVRRAAEFLLSLEGPVADARRTELEQLMSDLRTRWAAARTATETLAGTVGGRIVGVPEHPAGARARTSSPEATQMSTAELQLLDDGEWISSTAVIARLVEQLRDTTTLPERRVAAGANEQTRRELEEARSQLADLMAAARLVEQDLSMGKHNLLCSIGASACWRRSAIATAMCGPS
jgi:hypothetical protein